MTAQRGDYRRGADRSKLHEPDLAGLLVPATVSLAQVQRALAGLGISRATVDRLTEVVITPDAVRYELRLGSSFQRVAVETRIGAPDRFAVELRVTS